MIKSTRPVRGFWDWVATGHWDGGHGSTGVNG